MLYSLRGELIHVEDNFFVIECGGVGYLCKASANTISCLPPVGDEAFVYTQMGVTQDSVDLYGFYDRAEQGCFRMLTGVSGVGPKVALLILSDFTPDELALAVVTGDTKALTRVKGVGAKMAARVAMELKDKVSNEELSNSFGKVHEGIAIKGNTAEAVAALSALGYSQSEAAAALGATPADTPVEDMIKTALKALSKRR